MRALVDTHVLVWYLVEPGRLSTLARTLLDDPENEAVVSAVSAYEIEVKRDRDPVLARLPRDLEASVAAQAFTWRDITPADMIAAGRLPAFHRDPWDRVLAAQALLDGAPLLSIDSRLDVLGLERLW